MTEEINTDIGHWECEFEFDPEEYFGFIYLVTNLMDGRKYIGRKQFKMKKRVKVKGRTNRRITYNSSNWKKYTTSSTHVNKDLTEYGMDYFSFEIIELCVNKGHLSFRETELQWEHKVLSAVFDDGTPSYYNKAIGAIKFRCEGHTEATREKISRNSTPVRRFGADNPLSKQILQIDPKIGAIVNLWQSGMDIERELKISCTTIIACCKGKVKSSGEFIWVYHDNTELIEQRIEDYNNRKINTGSGKNHISSKRVSQLDKDTQEVIKVWGCMSTAGSELRINVQGISNVCRGTQKTAGGFKWEYV